MAKQDEPLSNCDLYLEWAHFNEFEFVFADRIGPSRDKSIGLLIQWQSLSAASEARKITDDLHIFVPSIYAEPCTHKEAGTVRLIWAITLPKDAIKPFLYAVWKERLAERIELAAPVFPRSKQTTNLIARKAKGPVLAAVLDDGCSFANARFRHAGKTRIVWLWNQTANAPGDSLTAGNGPSPAVNFGYGGQYSNDDLDGRFPPSGSQDEAYRDTGLTGLRRAASHGTHVMDLLAGPKDWEIAFVQFPRAGVDDPSGIWLKRYALDGLLYAIECAGPATKTIVANISWGPQTGPHDGSSILEKAFEMLIAEQKGLPAPRDLVISLAAGNSFGAQAHARIDYADGGQVDWLVPPDGEIPAFIELWWPVAASMADVCLRVIPPSGPAVNVSPGKNIPTDKTWWVKLKPVGQSIMALIVVNPTGGRASGAKAGQHGRWRIEIDPTPSGADGDVHVYVARAVHNMGARRLATASYLCDAALEAARFVAPDKRFDEVGGSMIRRGGTINGIATGPSTHVAAGYVYDTFASAPYSSSGPTRGSTTKPDFACVTDRSAANPGIRAAGVRSGTKAVLIGTSMAAPQLGRQVVDGQQPLFMPIPYRQARVGAACVWPDDELIPPG
jgi:hypothetical protein